MKYSDLILDASEHNVKTFPFVEIYGTFLESIRNEGA